MVVLNVREVRISNCRRKDTDFMFELSDWQRIVSFSVGLFSVASSAVSFAVVLGIALDFHADFRYSTLAWEACSSASVRLSMAARPIKNSAGLTNGGRACPSCSKCGNEPLIESL